MDTNEKKPDELHKIPNWMHIATSVLGNTYFLGNSAKNRLKLHYRGVKNDAIDRLKQRCETVSGQLKSFAVLPINKVRNRFFPKPPKRIQTPFYGDEHKKR